MTKGRAVGVALLVAGAALFAGAVLAVASGPACEATSPGSDFFVCASPSPWQVAGLAGVAAGLLASTVGAALLRSGPPGEPA